MPITIKSNLLKVRDNPNSDYLSIDAVSDSTTAERVQQIANIATTAQTQIESKKNIALSQITSVSDLQNIISETYSDTNTYNVGDYVIYNDNLYRCKTAITSAETWTAGHWTQVILSNEINLLHRELLYVKRYGVSGVGGSAAKLTRIWDAADFNDPIPSTNVLQGSSPFDNIKPFARRKCVGTWSKDPNSEKAIFTVNAYLGDGDYTENGTMGDYVAIDIEPFYYYQHDDIIAVSEYPYPGFTIHPVCVDAEGNVRKHTYIPVYAMAMVDGHPVSMPGYDNFRGGYADHMTNARKYNNADAKAYAIIEPAAVMHYEWLLMTIEYATQNMQAFINGAAFMRYSANDIIVSIPAANQIVVGAGGADLVVGQTIYMGSAYDAAVDVALYNHITAIRTCDENGTANENGDYYLITYDGADRTGTLVAGTSKFGSRPWITGATAGYAHGVHAVIGHTGSPVDLLNGRYPMRYRWRENVYGNQNMTLLDLMNIRVEDDTDVYHLDWYHLSDPRKATTSNPSKATLTNPSNGWARLSVFTPSDEYKNGYVKEFTPDTAHPHIRIPTVVTGASATTYSCNYAYLAQTYEVRVFRRGGSVAAGAGAGPYYTGANASPSNTHWHNGAALFFIQ